MSPGSRYGNGWKSVRKHSGYKFFLHFLPSGVCNGWLELIILFGRLPFRSGHFGIMFYTVIKNVLRYAMALFVMVIGFGFAFQITFHCQGENMFSDTYLFFRYSAPIDTCAMFIIAKLNKMEIFRIQIKKINGL